MELTYNDLKKREVINIADGKSLGKINNLKISFPTGVMAGIFVPGRRQNFFFALFDRSSIYIDQSKILKIGGDVILVNVNCGDVCESNVSPKRQPKKPICPPPCNPCSPYNPCDNSALGQDDGTDDGNDFFSY